MARIIAFVNHKGGVGKSTCAQNLAACLALRLGRRVLAVDLDSQGNLTDGLTAGEIDPERTAFRLLLDEVGDTVDYVLHLHPGLDLIPNAYERSVEASIYRISGQYRRLANHLAPIRSGYDVILLDTPPGLGLPTKSALAAADEVIIVLSSGYYALKGAATVLGVLADTQHEFRQSGAPVRVLLNNYDERRSLDRRIKAALSHAFGQDFFRTTIRANTQIGLAANARQSVVEYARRSVGSEDFTDLAKEILGFPLTGSGLSLHAPLSDRTQESGLIIPLAS